MKSVYLYWPNVIGYARVLLAVAACYLMPTHPAQAFVYYSVSCILDAADGYVARLCGECSSFGAVLDMVTDRSTTSCLLMHLCLLYPSYTFLFQFLVALDLCSHYVHMYATMRRGATSHKAVGPKAHPLLRLYYESRAVLFGVCAGNEIAFITLYMMYYKLASPLILNILYYTSLPICAYKQVLNIVQLISGLRAIGEYDNTAASKAASEKLKKSS